jgi:ribonuclease HII
MAWLVGIDEAGYGPNLGPFVMTSVACRLPPPLARCDLWKVLAAAVRRCHDASDGRPLIDDSKLVYASARGLAELEKSVLGTVLPCPASATLSLAGCVGRLSPAALTEVGAEVWYEGTTSLPVENSAGLLSEAAEGFASSCKENGVEFARLRSAIICPARFNGLLDRHGSKGVVLAVALAELLRETLKDEPTSEAVLVHIDKHGGRNSYAPILQEALNEGMVLAQEESRHRSVYRVEGAGRVIEVTFQPRADAAHFCVALASLVSKYLRELLMLEFNRFWQSHDPGLKPTAGYPVDAVRFLEAIRPAMQRLGIAEATVWRRK